MAIGDLVSVQFTTSILNGAGGNPGPALVGNLISAASTIATQFCRRSFWPTVYDEFYDGSGKGYLVLRCAPIMKLSTVVIGPSTNSPQFYYEGDFDINAKIARIAFKPTSNGVFYYDYTTSIAFPVGTNTVEAAYTAGFGFRGTISASIGTGSQVVAPNAMSGYDSVQAIPWTVTPGNQLIIDAGTSTEEVVSVVSASASTFQATFALAHGTGSIMLGALIPSDIQYATALMVKNIINQPDGTKKAERIGEYAYTVRDKEMIVTPEVRSLLGHYRDLVS